VFNETQQYFVQLYIVTCWQQLQINFIYLLVYCVYPVLPKCSKQLSNLTWMAIFRDLARILRPLVTFAEQI